MDLLLDNLDSLLATLIVKAITGMFLPAHLPWSMSDAQDLNGISKIAVIPFRPLGTAESMKARGFTVHPPQQLHLRLHLTLEIMS